MRRTPALVRFEKKPAEYPCALFTAADIRMVDREVRRTLMSSYPGIEHLSHSHRG